MNMQKLWGMPPAELACRSRQAIYKAVERVNLKSGGQAPLVSELFHGADHEITDVGSPGALFKQGLPDAAIKAFRSRFTHNAPRMFFAGAANGQVSELIDRYLPQMRDDILRSADEVCAGNFYTLGYGRLSYCTDTDSNAVNWHLDSVSGRVSPLLHWSRMNPLDFSQVGDSKVVWELNRHQWMIQLGMAWQLTGDDKYIDVLSQYAISWMRDNPPGFGINWCSSLEISYRLISWCWALVMLRDAAAMPPNLILNMMVWLQAHARHIERYLSIYYSPNTHITGEALGLFYAGTLFPDVEGAERWRVQGKNILLEQLQRQVHVDGVFFEQSTRYQYYTVEIYLQFMILCRQSGDELPNFVGERVQAMMDFLLDLRRPDGSISQIGDSDGGCLFPLIHREPGDFRALFSICAVLFQREDYAWAAGSSSAELICLMGPAGHYGFMALKPRMPLIVESSLYAAGGYLVMRNNRKKSGHQLIFDVGPLGCTDSAAHGHADLLSIQCSAFGDNYLVDAGTGNYTADSKWRSYFRSTHAHNTVTVDGLSQIDPAGPFSWRGRRPDVKLHGYWSTPQLALSDASHDAWSTLTDPIVHRRRIIFIRQRYWVIVDDLTARQTHDYDLHFQYGAVDVSVNGDGWTRATGQGEGCLLMHVSGSSDVTLALGCGSVNPTSGWVSDNYGHVTPAPALHCRLRADGAVRFTTVLVPMPDKRVRTPDIQILKSIPETGTDFLRINLDGELVDELVVTVDEITVTQGGCVCAE